MWFIPVGKITTHKNKTEFKSAHSSSIVDITGYEIQDKQRTTNNYLNAAKFIILGKVNKFKKLTNCDKVLIVMGGKGNFRDDLPLFTKYKDRANSFRPVCLKEIRDLLATLYPVEYSVQCEADDLISTYQYLGYKTKKRIIVCTEDKDARQTPGLLFNPRTETITDCSGFGELELQTKISSGLKPKKTYKVKGYGRLWFYFQCLAGDPVDTYHPFPKIYSDYKVYNLLINCKDDKDAWTVLVEEYKLHYGSITKYTDWTGKTHKGTWIDILQNYVDVVHMRRWENDRVDVNNVLTKYNLI